MNRGKPLRSDPDKVRAWGDRSREAQLERARGRDGQMSTLIRRAATAAGDFRDDAGNLIPASLSTLKPGRRKRKASLTKGLRARVLRRSEGLCVACVCELRRAGKPLTAAMRAVQLHHVLPEQHWPEHAKAEDNLVGVCVRHHARHESAFERLPRGALPEVVLRYAEQAGAYWYIEQTYPL